MVTKAFIARNTTSENLLTSDELQHCGRRSCKKLDPLNYKRPSKQSKDKNVKKIK